LHDYPTPRKDGWRVFVWFGVFFFFFDIVFFRLGFWALPNESAWGEHPFYNFEYRAREADSIPPEPGAVRIVFAGSSLALYSVLAPEFERELTARLGGRAVEVKTLSHQGMSTMHLAAYADRILAARPDVLVVPVGTVDFRIDRPIMQGIDRLDSPDPDVRRAALAESRNYTVAKPEFRMLAPAGWLREYRADLSMNQMSAALLARAVAAYRYRLLVWSPIETMLDNRLSRGRSYHEYAGVPVGGGGVSHRGWTGRVFELPVTPTLIADGVLLQAPSKLIAAAAPGTPLVNITRLTPNSSGAVRSHRRRYTLKAGWQTIRLRDAVTSEPERDLEAFPNSERTIAVVAGDCLRFELSHTVQSESEADERGLRLSRNAGRRLNELRNLGRELRREDDLYRGYSDAEYRESFGRRILRFDRAGSEYLEALKMARDVWARRAFDPELPGFVAFESFRKRLADAGVSLLIVNNPENPISLDWYGDSSWYADYVRFLAAGPDSGRYSFYDASRLLNMQMFYDYHHLSYHGAERYSRAVALKLAEVITNASLP
jgi:hypothetical protein